MPSVDLIATSAIASKAGWNPIDSFSAVARAFVLDRFGALVEAPLLVRMRDTRERECFVGTRAAFGAFAPASLILESAGAVSRMEHLVDAGDVRDRRFEATLPAVGRAFETPSSDGLWRALESVAAIVTNDELIIRCVDFAGVAAPGLRTVQRSGVRFVAITREALVSAFAAQWSAFVFDLGRALFYRDEEKCLEIPARAGLFALWYASASSVDGRTFRLAYDSIQHSSYVFVHDDDEPTANAGALPGLTAFRRPTMQAVVTLSWSDPTWNPIVNGFIVSGS